MKRILVTGGAGFVGATLALALKRSFAHAEVVAFDNLYRSGSELALPRLAKGGVVFCKGDVRVPAEIAAAGPFDLLLDCAAEPSVHAGYGESPDYLIATNLTGTAHCLEAARRQGAKIVFLSTSRVYPIAALRALPLERRGDRLVVPPGAQGPGWSERGIGPGFPMEGSRSLYGAAKLGSELLAEEFAAHYGLDVMVLRAGVLAGPWQMGKVDQGFMALWAARHLFGGPLAYRGFGGLGLQVRDVLHAEDLADLLIHLLGAAPSGFSRWMVGGGPDNAVSLCELTRLCQERSGRTIPIGADPETRPADIPWFVTDCGDLRGWRPRRGIAAIVEDLFVWLETHRAVLAPFFGGGR
ncbi:MAG: NAD-dependent epimerase/dehydratase family protein [Rhodospirillales bacterium]|nr:NAD-dependent epimerase/dehydratase family protein [Rhodospirillales bacterium]